MLYQLTKHFCRESKYCKICSPRFNAVIDLDGYNIVENSIISNRLRKNGRDSDNMKISILNKLEFSVFQLDSHKSLFKWVYSWSLQFLNLLSFQVPD